MSESSCVAVNETLKILELDNCPLITDASLEQLHNFHSLSQLEIYDCQLITKSGIKKLQVTFFLHLNELKYFKVYIF